VKLDESENRALSDLLHNNINLINEQLEQNDLTSEAIKNRIEDGDYELEDIISNRNLFGSILKKLKTNSVPGASYLQHKTLSKTAALKIKKTEEIIIATLNSLEIFNTEITVASVTKNCNLSFNTVKKYRDQINERENHRLNK